MGAGGPGLVAELGLMVAIFAPLFFTALGVIQDGDGQHQQPERAATGLTGSVHTLQS